MKRWKSQLCVCVRVMWAVSLAIKDKREGNAWQNSAPLSHVDDQWMQRPRLIYLNGGNIFTVTYTRKCRLCACVLAEVALAYTQAPSWRPNLALLHDRETIKQNILLFVSSSAFLFLRLWIALRTPPLPASRSPTSCILCACGAYTAICGALFSN